MWKTLRSWISRFLSKPTETRIVLIRKITQPIGTVSEMYVDKQYVSFVYDTLPPGERIYDSRAISFSVGNNAKGANEVTVSQATWPTIDSIRPTPFLVEVLERWAVKC